MKLILQNCVLIGLGGFIGSIARYLMALGVSRISQVNFPVGTLLVNTLGCLVLGICVALFERSQVIPREIHLFLVTGILGSFTTFSALSMETLALFYQGETAAAFLNIGASLLLGLGAIVVGLNAVRFAFA